MMVCVGVGFPRWWAAWASFNPLLFIFPFLFLLGLGNL
jgi:hypothetical protein